MNIQTLVENLIKDNKYLKENSNYITALNKYGSSGDDLKKAYESAVDRLEKEFKVAFSWVNNVFENSNFSFETSDIDQLVKSLTKYTSLKHDFYDLIKLIDTSHNSHKIDDKKVVEKVNKIIHSLRDISRQF